MTAWIRVVGQFIVLAALFGVVAVFSDWPSYRQLAPGMAVIKLSFTHGSNRQAECRRRTAAELAKLPPNMRAPLECPRERGAVYVELDIDGRPMFRASLPPSGISWDGPSRVYQKFVVPAGTYMVAVRMRDTPRTQGFDYAKSDKVTLAAEQNFVVDFRPGGGGFVFQ